MSPAPRPCEAPDCGNLFTPLRRSNARYCPGGACKQRAWRASHRPAPVWPDRVEEKAAFLREEALVEDVQKGYLAPWDAILRVVAPPPELHDASRQRALDGAVAA
jgi:hypothetical protein